MYHSDLEEDLDQCQYQTWQSMWLDPHSQQYFGASEHCSPSFWQLHWGLHNCYHCTYLDTAFLRVLCQLSLAMRGLGRKTSLHCSCGKDSSAMMVWGATCPMWSKRWWREAATRLMRRKRWWQHQRSLPLTSLLGEKSKSDSGCSHRHYGRSHSCLLLMTPIPNEPRHECVGLSHCCCWQKSQTHRHQQETAVILLYYRRFCSSYCYCRQIHARSKMLWKCSTDAIGAKVDSSPKAMPH